MAWYVNFTLKCFHLHLFNFNIWSSTVIQFEEHNNGQCLKAMRMKMIDLRPSPACSESYRQKKSLFSQNFIIFTKKNLHHKCSSSNHWTRVKGYIYLRILVNSTIQDRHSAPIVFAIAIVFICSKTRICCRSSVERNQQICTKIFCAIFNLRYADRPICVTSLVFEKHL